MSIDKSIDSVKLGRLKAIIKSVETHGNDNTDLTFEFLIASCFPRCYKNVQNALRDEYTKGYIDGRNDSLRSN